MKYVFYIESPDSQIFDTEEIDLTDEQWIALSEEQQTELLSEAFRAMRLSLCNEGWYPASAEDIERFS